MVRRAHEARPPAHKRVVEPWLVRVAGEQAVVDARLGKSGVRLCNCPGRRTIVCSGFSGLAVAVSVSVIDSADERAQQHTSHRGAEWVTATSRPVIILSAHWGDVPPSLFGR